MSKFCKNQNLIFVCTFDLNLRRMCINHLTFCMLFIVIQALVALVNDPEPEHPLRAELAEEYLKDRKKFIKNAEEFTKKHGEKRPSD